MKEKLKKPLKRCYPLGTWNIEKSSTTRTSTLSQIDDLGIMLLNIPDFKPIDHKVYPLTESEPTALEEFLDENICTGRISSSKSPMGSPFFDSCMYQWKLQYLIKWKEYPNCLDWTWEPKENLQHSPKLIKDFHNAHPNAPWRITHTPHFDKIMKDNIPVFVPCYLCSSTGQIFDWEDGVFKRHN